MAPNLPSLKTITLDQIATSLDSTSFTVSDLVQAHLDRIAQFNPVLRAVIELNPNALLIAQGLDEELKTTGRRGLLHGVPILVKDNIVTFEDISAAAGSLALVGAKPARESPVVSSLRSAGCVILGSANMSEWANFRSNPSDSGWSARGGQAYGAYCEKMNPSGSSSGSAIGLDMGLCVLALGSETSGSIISPADFNGVVGVKPTTGLVSRRSVVPISFEQDTVGPMARTVEDAAVMLSVMAGRDSEDSKTESIPFDEIPDYRAACKLRDISKFRLGVPRNALAKMLPQMLESFDDVIKRLREKGAVVVDFEYPGLAKYDDLTSDEKSDFIAGDFHESLDRYLGNLVTIPSGTDSLEKICEYTKTTEGEEFPDRNIYRLEHTLRVSQSSPEYHSGKERAAYFAGDGGIQGALDTHNLDAILVLSSVSNYFAACGGSPQISVPLDYQADGTEVKMNDTGNLVEQGPNIPYGFSVVGPRFSEEKLFSICAVVEELTQARQRADDHHLPQLRG